MIVDPLNRIQESNEDNNTAQIMITINSIPSPQNRLGDYDHDDDVDAADYVLWRNTLGTIILNVRHRRGRRFQQSRRRRRLRRLAISIRHRVSRQQRLNGRSRTSYAHATARSRAHLRWTAVS